MTEGIYFEDLCFDCQQSVEKSLKALFVMNNIEFPYSHNISRLIDILVENKINVPENIFDAAILADYAVETRYPGDYEPVLEDEFLRALEIAKNVFKWVSSKI